MTAALMNLHVRDNLSYLYTAITDLISGATALAKVRFDGVTTGSAPAVSVAGDANVYYNTTIDKLMLSKNSGVYRPAVEAADDPMFVATSY